MATNLIELLTKEFGGDTLGKLAGLLGEPENKVQAAVGGLAPAMVAALANKASSGSGLTDLFGLMKSAGFDGSQTKGLRWGPRTRGVALYKRQQDYPKTRLTITVKT